MGQRIRKDSKCKYTTKDEVLFLKAMMQKRTPLERLLWLAGYSRGLRKRVRWGEINKRRLWTWLLILRDAVVMDYANIYQPGYYRDRIDSGKSLHSFTVQSLLEKSTNRNGYKHYWTNHTNGDTMPMQKGE